MEDYWLIHWFTAEHAFTSGSLLRAPSYRFYFKLAIGVSWDYVTKRYFPDPIATLVGDHALFVSLLQPATTRSASVKPSASIIRWGFLLKASPSANNWVKVMKRSMLILSLGAAILLSQSASADDRFYNPGFSNWRGNNFYGQRGGGRFYRPTYSGVFDRGYYGGGFNGSRHRNRGGFVSFSYNNFQPWHRPYRGVRRWDGGAFVGGVVLGSLLSQPVRERSVERVVYRTQAAPRAREVIYAGEPRRTSVSTRRRLLRDLEGNCFERTTNAAGDEVRIELDPSECAY